MTYRHAKRLHRGDEIQLKSTKEYGKVLSISVTAKIICIEAIFPTEGYVPCNHLTHWDIR